MRAPDLYITAEPTLGDRRVAIEHIVKEAAKYGHDMARLGLTTPDLTIEWTDQGRIKIFNQATPRRWWKR